MVDSTSFVRVWHRRITSDEKLKRKWSRTGDDGTRRL